VTSFTAVPGLAVPGLAIPGNPADGVPVPPAALPLIFTFSSPQLAWQVFPPQPTP
jgi:hypothetical protein